MNTSEPIAVSVDEAAHLVGISRGALYPLVMSGEIRSLKIGARRLVPLAELRRWLEERTEVLP